jgi:hypothetical protein
MTLQNIRSHGCSEIPLELVVGAEDQETLIKPGK